jgi:Tfp pilus assembly protein PilO
MILTKRVPLPTVSAFGILALILLMIWFVIIDPVVWGWIRRVEEADRAAELIAHLRGSASDAKTIEAEIKRIGAIQHDHGAILVAVNPNLAAANLQAEVKRIVEANGAQLRSIQQTLPVTESELTRVGVRADIQGDTQQLSHFLYDLESHSPVFLSRRLLVRGSEQQITSVAQKATPLTIELEVTALTGPSE